MMGFQISEEYSSTGKQIEKYARRFAWVDAFFKVRISK
jgi:hypothetical protein